MKFLSVKILFHELIVLQLNSNIIFGTKHKTAINFTHNLMGSWDNQSPVKRGVDDGRCNGSPIVKYFHPF